MNKKTPTKKVYIVLGMHRSATSLIAKALHDQGIDMGKGFVKGSKTGQETYEDAFFVKINEQMLQDFGASWDKPPNKHLIFDLIRQKKGYKFSFRPNKIKWGWKDPRTCLTFPFYLEGLQDRDIYLICVFRKPRYVANSLKKRNGFSIKKGIKLAQEYNKRIIEHIKLFLNRD